MARRACSDLDKQLHCSCKSAHGSDHDYSAVPTACLFPGGFATIGALTPMALCFRQHDAMRFVREKPSLS